MAERSGEFNDLSGELSPAQRAVALDQLAEDTFDVLIIGGGVTGSGCALDAAARGLRVGLIEQRDIASGTSSRSSKLIHGGLRYLEQLNFRLVAEALGERSAMLNTLAPHLVRPVSFLYPLQHRAWERVYVGAGIALYDTLASRGKNPMPRHRHLSKREALKRIPGLDGDQIVGAIQYWDAQVDDARHTLFLARTAAAHGATVASSVRACGLLRRNGRIVGVEASCGETGRTMSVDAKIVVNATATWTDEIQAMAGPSSLRVRASKGVHLVVRRDRIAGDIGLITKTPSSVLFVIPWGDRWLIGTTDTEWNLDLAHPAASRSDIEYLLGQVNRWLADPLDADDIVGVYAGLRPLLEGESDNTSSLSREHAVTRSAPGLITVAGGKYTTYRVMAADAIDAVANELGTDIPESCTDSLPLLGADGLAATRNRSAALAEQSGLSIEQIERLLGRYGSLIVEVLDLIDLDPTLAETVTDDTPYLAAEIRYGAEREGVLHLDDVLTRRTRISIESASRGVDAAPVVAALVAPVLGWDQARINREIEHYRSRVEAEIESQTMPDDQTADAARLGAADVRTMGRPS